MKNRRSKLEIYIEVLKVIKEGTTKPTRIMYGANLSWQIVQDVLDSMVGQDLIEEIDMSKSRDKRTTKVYRVTTKGDSSPTPEGVISNKTCSPGMRLVAKEKESPG